MDIQGEAVKMIDVENSSYYGTHNTMTYGSVTNWFISAASKIFAKCQSITVDKQMAISNALDLRIYFDCKDNVEYENAKNYIRYSHGKAKYQSTQQFEQFFSILDEMSKKLEFTVNVGAATLSNPGIVRLILEHADSSTKETWFKKLCEEIQQKYPSIVFTGGFKKDGWVALYDFNKNRPDAPNVTITMPEGNTLYATQKGIIITEANIHQWVSSMASDALWYEKVYPLKYATRKNSENYIKIITEDIKGIHLFDFV